MTETRRRLPSQVAAAVVPLLLAGCSGVFPQSTFRPASDFAVELDDLYMTIFWWAVLVFVVVVGVLIYVIVRYRARDGGRAAQMHGNTLLEISWTLAPVVILIFIAIPTMRVVFESYEAPGENAVTVQVIGHQWWWEIRYPGREIITANEIHIPVGRPVVLEMTSQDVIHAYWVPRLAGKRDLTLGDTTHLFFTADSVGVFSGQCAEFCGISHANMRTLVFVDDSATFEQWLDVQERPATEPDSLTPDLRAGWEEFTELRDPSENSCIACHAVTGVSGGVLGPNLTHLGSRATIASGLLPNTPEQMARWLADPPAVKPGSLMPDVGLTEQEIAALVPYLQSLR